MLDKRKFRSKSRNGGCKDTPDHRKRAKVTSKAPETYNGDLYPLRHITSDDNRMKAARKGAPKGLNGP